MIGTEKVESDARNDRPSYGLGQKKIQVRRLGRVSYGHALARQRRLVTLRRAGSVDDQLILTEHDPVVTLGRGGDMAQVRGGTARLRELGIEFYVTDRGGGATFHGPGQLVVYPIIDLGAGGDIHAYLRSLESVVISTLRDFDLEAARAPGFTGVWIGDSKISASGIRVSRWVTSHGVSINVDNDLEPYRLINQCGLSDRGVTSVAAQKGRSPGLNAVAASFIANFCTEYGHARVASGPRNAGLSEAH